MKKQGKVGNIAEKSGSHLQERTFYQCYCARNYLSYSALYLHVKNKHNQNLSFKNFCRRRTHWSGSVKNVILQFDEEAGDQIKKEPLSLNLRQRPKRQCLKQASSESEVDKPINKKVKVQENDQNLAEGKTVANVFELYSKIGETRDLEFRRELLNQFMQYIDRNYQNFMPIEPTKIVRSFSNEQDCQEIPLFLNTFFEKQCLESPARDRIIGELIKLSSWLYQNSFSTRLAIKIEDLKNHVCKVEEQEKVKIQKIENDQF